jgi:hypothetical protein
MGLVRVAPLLAVLGIAPTRLEPVHQLGRHLAEGLGTGRVDRSLARVDRFLGLDRIGADQPVAEGEGFAYLILCI